MNQQSPEFVDFDPLNTHSLLTVPPKIERHSSEPAPSMTPSSPHLLSVPSGPLLVKQHSHPLLPSQSTSPPSSVLSSFALHRQLSHPTPSSSSAISASEAILASTGSCTVSTTTFSQNTGNVHFVTTSIKQEMEQASSGPMKTSGGQSPSVILVSDPITTSSSSEHIPTIRVKSEELHRSVSTPQTSGEMILEPRSSHCPVIRPGPALGCNFCWNTIDAHGRILRRKTKYHCPECQTNLCIVPCFQEYHERQSSDNPSNENTSLSSGKNASATNLRHYPKTGSI